MENAMSSGKVKVPKVRTLNENVPPLQIELDDKRGRYLQSTTMSPRFQPYGENIDAGSPLARYFYGGSPISGNSGEALTPPTFGSSKYRSTKTQQYCGTSSGNSSFGSRGRLSLSPLSSIENLEIAPRMSPPMYGTPVKVDEEVLVMDDIKVRPISGGKSGRSSSSSSGRGSTSSSSSSKSAFKTEICWAWEESGNCRYSSKCQFAHGKEDLHSSRLAVRSKTEAQTGILSIRPGQWIYGPITPFVHEHHAAADYEHGVTTSQPASPKSHHNLANSNTINDWSPLDDGIEVVLPNGSGKVPSREEVDAHIFGILHGQTTKRRLPVFAALCKGQYSP